MSAFRALLGKDLRREARSKEALLAGLVLVALAFLATLFAAPGDDHGTVAALLWTPLLFATVALVGRGFASELDRGTILLLRAAPVPLAWHGWSRTLVHLLVAAVVAAASLAVSAGLFAFTANVPLLVTLLLAVIGLAVVGTLASAISAQARTREVLLPVLLVPVAAPLLQAGVRATVDALAGGSWGDLQTPLLLMLGYDIAAVGVAWLLWPLVLEGD
jgi:ABC-type transport system involved in cytochrome c biogenesis permease component